MFNLLENIEQLIKLILICEKGRNGLNLEDYKPYTDDKKNKNISKSKRKSLINIANLQFISGIYSNKKFYQILIDPLKSQYINNPELFNI